MVKLAYDKEGFLRDLDDWTPSVAATIAANENVTLTPAHWRVLETLRAFYAETDVSPAMRPFVKIMRERLGEEFGTSIALMQLFGDSPAKTAAKIAGLPRPTNCL